MSWLRLVLRSLAYHRGVGALVGFGLTIATAVVTGALVTGDSVSGSLRDTGLARLGRVDYALAAPTYFPTNLAERLAAEATGGGPAVELAAAVVTQGAARNLQTEVVTPGVTVFGVDEALGRLQGQAALAALNGRQCALNRALAGDLGVQAGESLLLTLHHQRSIATLTLFARRGRQEVAPSLRLTVAEVLPEGGPGDFRLNTQSSTPRNLFVSRDWLTQQLGLEGRANVLLAACPAGDRRQAGERLQEGLAKACVLDDLGLSVKANDEQGYVSLLSEAMLLSEPQVQAAMGAGRDCGARVALTSVYLATRIARSAPSARREIAYAVIAGLEPLAPFPGAGRKAAPSEGCVWVNAWAAEDLGCRVGETLEVSYLVPTADGTYPEARTKLRLEAIVGLSGPAADRGLTPDFEGMTDAAHVKDWDPPFPIDLTRVTDRDEEYWERYRATPKAFASVATVRAMWQSAPTGKNSPWVTSVRVAPPTGGDAAALQESLAEALGRKLTPQASGLAFAPLRRLTLGAAKGTSDFRQLFLGLSMFLVFSGAGLAGMLLRLSVDRRASDVGLLLACGCHPGGVSRALFAEGVVLTASSALVGVPLGVLYAGGLIRALGAWWQGALGDTPGLWLHVQPGSLLAGGLCGLCVGLLVAALSVRRLRGRPVLELLSGWQAMEVKPDAGRPWAASLLLLASAGGGLLLGGLAHGGGPVAPQGAFFGIGAALLVAGLASASLALRRLRRSGGATRSLPRLALRNAAAAGGRSLLTLGLLACATFVVVATATNARDFSASDVTNRQSGAGGFSLVATSSVPLAFDVGAPAGRANLGFAPGDEAELEGVEIVSLLASPGEDVSCLNLARPSAPRVLGVPAAMVERGGFSPISQGRGEASWKLLEPTETGGAVPAFGDAASVQWTLHSGLGKVLAIPAGKLRFVGLLPGSLFAGELLVSEANFRRLFPAVSAPSFFLIATPPGREQAVAEVLRRNLGELGLEVRTTRETLNDFIRVQNTYLSMFLTLGGLGLLLGTVGLGATLMRSALERRRELALMSAVGFDRGKVGRALLIENGALLVAALVWGTAAALVAVAPHLASPEAQVNWVALLGVLAAVLVLGLVTCLGAVRSALRGEPAPALRRE
ncbi:MAG: FtsX-like permease family protein [Armatimonadetes bacterium]|nr:FtsX-like permease family protein [Armatimonadota bacterium]